ncbi:MAG TPA: low temperature requirement protein A [Mycobacteriales bacterium]|nr:low temperature requirement protein A [Mycobacteriales bacterium]
MTARSRDEPHRASTPLELLFDLCFVVAVSQAAIGLHHELAAGQVGAGLLRYAMIFFAIWWAWMNFTWFASAYDTDDVPYRLLTLVQIAGVLILAAGVSDAFEHFDLTTVFVGYVIMRVAMIAQWLRAAAEFPDGRDTALRYAAGVAFCQLCWALRLLLPAPWAGIAFGVLVLLEIAVPIWAEFHGNPTTWHPEHINERYGLFTLIVLGECVAAATVAIQSATTDHGLSARLLVLAGAGLVLVFGLWWSYFKHDAVEGLQASLWWSILWGYSHYLIFGAVAALGAGLEVVVESLDHGGELSTVGSAFTVAIPVAVFLVVAGPIHALMTNAVGIRQRYVIGTAALVLISAALAGALTLCGSVVAMAVLVAAVVGAGVVVGQRPQR